MLSSAEHEIFSAYKYENANFSLLINMKMPTKIGIFIFISREKFKIFSAYKYENANFSLLINMKMPTKVGIFIFISREKFMLSNISHTRFSNC